ncbi:MAG: hypothetical protein SynsKO_01840 [Synoicihabitans sp.]
MNLKILSISVLVLAVLSGIVAWINRPAAPANADPRVGTSLLENIDVNAATAFTVANNDDSVALARDESGAWSVESYHGLPADEDKLRRLMQDLNEANLARVVTRNPERAARLNLGEASVAVTAGDTHRIVFGQSASRGGRYVKLAEADDAPVYLTPATTFIDALPKNWAKSDLTSFDPADIQAVTLTLEDGSTVDVHRETVEATWTAKNTPEGKQLRLQPITSLLTSFNSLRFTNTAEPSATDVVDAAAAARAFTLTTFDGETLHLKLGRRPEETVVKSEPENPVDAIADLTSGADSAPETAEEALEDLTETIPAGPVFAFIEGPAQLAPLAKFTRTLAFEVSSYSFTSLPTDADAIWEDAPISDTQIDGPIPATE